MDYRNAETMWYRPSFMPRIGLRLFFTILSLLHPVLVRASTNHQYSIAVQQTPILPTAPEEDGGPITIASLEQSFTLRHVFHRGSSLYPELHRRFDVAPYSEICSEEEEREGSSINTRVQSSKLRIQRLKDRTVDTIQDHLAAARYWGHEVSLDQSEWTVDYIPGPNITDKETVVGLAIMAANSYAPLPHEGDWEDLNNGFNNSGRFGWENDGLRGYVFADKDNSTVVIAIKGTSISLFDGSETTTEDKANDNLIGSCCCGQGGQYLWHQACDCYQKAYTCNQPCLVRALNEENRYFRSAIELYGNVTKLYPSSNIWLVGHSLGGAVSGLLAQVFGVPAVTFEAYGDALASKRLGLPLPPGVNQTNPYARIDSGIYHFGHTADPVYMGTCNRATASCTLAGYAFETMCHSGHYCQYDTVADKGFKPNILNHRILPVIRDVLRAYDKPAKCVLDANCTDCQLWIFDSNSTQTKTSLSASTTSSNSWTRTEICRTPGWWGCRDESTSLSATSTSTITMTTTTCKSYGW